MNAAFRLLVCLVPPSLLLSCGCSGPTARVVVAMEGASPKSMDEKVAQPLASKLRASVKDVASITSVSGAGRVELYVRGGVFADPGEFLQNLKTELLWPSYLPAGAAVRQVELLSEEPASPASQPDHIVRAYP